MSRIIRTVLDHAGATGPVALHVTGESHVYIATDGAHVNDDTEAVTYRGRRFLVAMDATLQPDGQWVIQNRKYGTRFAPVGQIAKGRYATASEVEALTRAVEQVVASHVSKVDRLLAEKGRLADEMRASFHDLEAARAEVARLEKRHFDLGAQAQRVKDML